MVSWPLMSPVYDDQHWGAQAGHQGQESVTQGQVSDEQQRQAPGRGLTETRVKSSVTSQLESDFKRARNFCTFGIIHSNRTFNTTLG